MARTRTQNVTAAQWSPNGGTLGAPDLTLPGNQVFGANVFSIDVQRARLPKSVFKRLQAALDVIAKNPSAATGRYLGRRTAAKASNGQNGHAANGNGQRDAHGQPGANAAVKQAEEMAHDGKPY